MFKAMQQYLKDRSLKDVSEIVYTGDETTPILLTQTVSRTAKDLILGTNIKDVRELSLEIIKILERPVEKEVIALEADDHARFHRATLTDKRGKFLGYRNRVVAARGVITTLLSSEPFTRTEKEYLGLVKEVDDIVDEHHRVLHEAVMKANSFIRKYDL